ncbi:MAG: hypothetical protein ACREDZ_02290 [Kiloniellales bacterium]
MTPAHSQFAEWYAWAASIPLIGLVIGLAFRNRAKLASEVLRLEKALAEHRLDVAKGYASNEELREVERRLTVRIAAMERNIVAQLQMGAK